MNGVPVAARATAYLTWRKKGKGGALVLTEGSDWPEKERSVDGDADRRRGGSRARVLCRGVGGEIGSRGCGTGG